MHPYVRTQGESWEKVAVILAAVDRSLGIDLNVAMSNAKQQVGSTQKVRLRLPRVRVCACVSYLV